MTLSMEDLNDILIIKTGKNLSENLKEKPKKRNIKRNERIYLTRIQYNYLNLISNVTKFIFIKDKNFVEILYKLLNKKKLTEDEVIENREHVIKLLNTDPDNLYKFIKKKLSNEQYESTKKIREYFLYNYNLKCIHCHRFCYKLNYCKKHFLQKDGINGNKEFTIALLNSFKTVDLDILQNFFSILERELINKIKLLESNNDSNQYNIDFKINRVQSITEYCKEFKDHVLMDIIYNYVKNNSKELRKFFNFDNANIKYNKIKGDKIIETIKTYSNNNNLEDINEKIKYNLKNVNTTSSNYMRISNIIIINYINFHLNLINRIKYFIKKNKIENQNNLSKLFINLSASHFIAKESNNYEHTDFKMILLEKIYGSKYNLRNLSINKYFEDHYYNLNGSLTYDVYGEIFNNYHKIYIPFVINVPKYTLVNNVTMAKKFYCFINNIPFLDLLKIDFAYIIKFMNYISEEKNFFIFGKL